MIIFDKDDKRRFLEGVSDVPDILLTAWTDRIRREARSAELEGLTIAVLHDFCRRHLFGRPQSQVTLNWLDDAFSRLLQHESSETVFPLPKRARHRPTSTHSDAIIVAWWVHLAITRRGYSRVAAKGLAAEMFAKDEKSIARYCKQAAEWVAGMSQAAEWEAFLINEGKPLPKTADKKSRVPVPTKRR